MQGNAEANSQPVIGCVSQGFVSRQFTTWYKRPLWLKRSLSKPRRNASIILVVYQGPMGASTAGGEARFNRENCGRDWGEYRDWIRDGKALCHDESYEVDHGLQKSGEGSCSGRE